MKSDRITQSLGILFIVLGLLNLMYIHPAPAILYFLLSLVYFPLADTILNLKFRVSIPFWVKVVLAIVVLWGTLTVGDLAETFGF